MSELARAGVPVGVMTAPIIPGLNDQEIPAILAAAEQAGARRAGYVLLRLPYAVRPIFEDWLRRCYPEKADRVVGLIRETRDGRMNNHEFGKRMRGAGQYAEQIEAHVQGLSKAIQSRSAVAAARFVQVHSAPAAIRTTALILMGSAPDATFLMRPIPTLLCECACLKPPPRFRPRVHVRPPNGRVEYQRRLFRQPAR